MRNAVRSILCLLILSCAAGCGTAESPGQTQAQAQTSVAASQASTTAASPSAPSAAAPTSAAATSAAPAAQAATPAAARMSVAPAQLPDFTAESWTPQTAGPVRDVSGHDIELNECATVHAATTWQQQPYASSGGNSALLETYTFHAAADAEAAYTGVLSGMRSCQATSRALQSASRITPDAVVRQTATASGATAFQRTWTGVEGVSAGGPQTNHLYLAAHGSTLLILHFDVLAAGTTAGSYDVRNDPSVLSMLTAVLAGGTGSR